MSNFNVIPLKTTGGFTRMDNKLIEALMVVDLPGRELKVALFVARATIGYQVAETRIQATEIAKATNVHPDVASKAISHLLKRRILYRIGGSRGDIGISDPSEWVYFDQPKQCPTQTISSDSDQKGRVVSITSQTKSDDSLLYTKKNPLLTLSSKEVNPPPAESHAVVEGKPARKTPFGMIQMLANNPHQIPDQLLVDWLALRKTKRAAVSQTVWGSLNAELTKCAELGIAASDAMTEALAAGWQGFKADWIAKRLAQADRAPTTASAGPDFYSQAWRADLSDEL